VSEFVAKFANDTFQSANVLTTRVDVCAQRIQLNSATHPAVGCAPAVDSVGR